MAYRAINDCGIIGNTLTAALVATDGTIDWCCLPRFDAPSVFAGILDDEKGGRFQISPQLPYKSRQAYLPDSNVLQTTFQTDTGKITVVDFMPCYRTPGGRLSRFNEIHRLVECTAGRVALEVVFEPRLNYARGTTALSISEHGVTASRGSERLTLSSPHPFTVDGGRAISRLSLDKGQQATFILGYGADKPRRPGSYGSTAKLKGTLDYWHQKAKYSAITGPWRKAIIRSNLVLHLLLYSPTGAIVAAPTTSLPEQIGGQRNWDYRFAWLRDASLTLNAFYYMGHTEEALGFMKWLISMCTRCGPRAQILYDIELKDPPPEQVLEHLSGYRNSRPVRIGNDAYQQHQLDIYGEVLESAENYLIIGGYISRRTWQLLERFVDAACKLWHQPGSGIWEVRGSPRHFVHSKLMCWVAVDRGIRIAKKLGYKNKLARWRKAARDIRKDILTRGWNSERQAFTQHYDTQALDASNLHIPLVGFLPASDKRVISTVERTVAELGWNGLLRRYRTEETDDGLGGPEGAFLACSFWLVRNLLRQDKMDEAISLYEKLLGYGNHLGLFSEMADPDSGEALGNFPQAFTHLAIITTGLELMHLLHTRKGSRAGLRLPTIDKETAGR